MKICSVNLHRENNFLTLALIRLAGPWYVLRGPDSSRGALIRLTGPCFVHRDPIRPAGLYFVLPALIRLAGPDCPAGP